MPWHRRWARRLKPTSTETFSARARTHDGKAVRMLCVIDEFTRESLAIRVARKLKSTDIIEALCELFVLQGISPTGCLAPGRACDMPAPTRGQ